MLVESKPIKMQINCGATVCLIPKSKIGDKSVEPAKITLEMWNKDKKAAVGTCKLRVTKPRTDQTYLVKFVVVEDELSTLISRKVAEKMNLIAVNYNNFWNISVVEPAMSKLDRFPDVFGDELGTLPGTVTITLDPQAEPVVRSPKRIPVELKTKVREELERLVNIGVLAPVQLRNQRTGSIRWRS